MSDTMIGKELVPASESTEAVVKRSKPHLIEVRAGRYICSTGRFHLDLAVEFVLSQRGRWITIAELARTFAGANTIPGKRRVRQNLHRLFNRVLMCGEFLVYEMNPTTRETQAVKVLDVTSEQERQLAQSQLRRMLQNKDLSLEKYERAIQVIQLHEALVKAE